MDLSNKLGETKVLVVLPRPEIVPDPRDTLENLPLAFSADIDNALVQRTYSLDFKTDQKNQIASKAKAVKFNVLDISDFVFPGGEIELFSAKGDLNIYDYAHWTVPFGAAVGGRISVAYPELPIKDGPERE